MAAAIGGFLSAPLMFTLAPLAEGLFGHVTRLTISEWLSYEHPLLRKLASTAPGTFQHSVNVGVLADAAAGAIGADALLARVGGLYHDVGKMNAPAYSSRTSTGRILTMSSSRRKAREFFARTSSTASNWCNQHRMGERIADFVREHHGSGEMRLLRDKAEALGQSFTEEPIATRGRVLDLGRLESS